MAILDTDTFASRTVSSGFGTASDGSVWSAVSGLNKTSVSSNEGLFSANNTLPLGSLLILGSTSAADVNASIRFSVVSVTDTLALILRYQDSNNFISAEYANGNLTIQKKVAGTVTTIATTSTTISASTFYFLRCLAQGSSYSLKVWLASSSEPTTWTLTGTDATTFSTNNYGLNAFVSLNRSITVDSYTVSLAVSSLALVGKTTFSTRLLSLSPTRTHSLIRVSAHSFALSKYLTRLVANQSHRSRFFTKTFLVSRSRSRFSVKVPFSISARSKSFTRIRAALFSRLRFLARSALFLSARSQFILFSRFLTQAKEKFSARSRLQTPSRTRFLVRLVSLLLGRSRFLIHTPLQQLQALPHYLVKSLQGAAGRGRFPVRMPLRSTLQSSYQTKFRLSQLHRSRSLLRSLFGATGQLAFLTRMKQAQTAKGSFSLRWLLAASVRSTFKVFSQLRSLLLGSQIRFSARSKVKQANRSAFSLRVPALFTSVDRFSVRWIQKLFSQAKFATRTNLRQKAKTRNLIQHFILSTFITRFSTRYSHKLIHQVRYAIRVPLRLFAQARFSSRMVAALGGKGRFSVRGLFQNFSRVRFFRRSQLSQQATLIFKLAILKAFLVAAQTRFQTRKQTSFPARTRFSVRFSLLTGSKGRFPVRSFLKAAAHFNFFSRMLSRLVSFSRFSPRFPFLSSAWSRFLSHNGPVHKKLRIVIAPALTKLSVNFFSVNKLKTRFSSTSKLLVRIFSIVANPYSSIAVTALVSDPALNPQTNIPSITVLVNFPDGSQSTYSMASGDILNQGNGNYQLTYVTKGPGNHRETWTFTNVDGTLATYQNITYASY